MSSVEVITFGCRLNAYESEAIRARAAEAGLQNTVIVNTCAVTKEAVRQSRQAVRRQKRARPDAKIIVTGCAAQTEPETFDGMPDVDFVLGNAEKLSRASYADFGLGTAERVKVNDVFSMRETAAQFVDGFEGRARAFLQVQNGCDHRCTFCIIPFGRGNSRSVPVGAAVQEARRLTERGYVELVLTGVDLTAYGADLPGRPTLGSLVRKLLKHVPAIARLRLSSIDAVEVDAELMRAIAEEERLMPHLHLSVQSGDDLILKRMKRRHSRRDIIAFCEKVRQLRPEIAFGADLIAGFPTESESMFENTMDLVEDADLSYLHVFPFSARQGTPASRMPQIERSAVRDRAARLRGKGALQLQKRLTGLVGSEQTILVEKARCGRTECFASTRFLDVTADPGSVLRARITGAGADHLKAELSM
ncbi:MAG TPA: tRNA (N(6)-L-threonylcarbamoyladenosine(37)-C(2))-methylthiotransferase MtaB [Rhizomicrobium sp.]|jgi:threonylcarbamoyladenosine tRNA methylthiotransferase MtaB|nr:tRNA (N(6)-L-threonylcarbamoyladenosine(37)-C(2))-methylthiotransferase MtaB [Rhizomicrobium sp.]